MVGFPEEDVASPTFIASPGADDQTEEESRPTFITPSGADDPTEEEDLGLNQEFQPTFITSSGADDQTEEGYSPALAMASAPPAQPIVVADLGLDDGNEEFDLCESCCVLQA